MPRLMQGGAESETPGRSKCCIANRSNVNERQAGSTQWAGLADADYLIHKTTDLWRSS